MPAYTTRKFLALVILSLLAGVAVVGGTGSTVRFLFPTAPQPDFSVACCWPIDDGTLTVSAAATYNSSYNSWVTLSSINGFTGSIAVTAIFSLPVSINPSSVSLTKDGRVQSSLTVSVPKRTQLGVYTGTITGKSGSLTRSISIHVNVVSPPPDFTITASLSSVGIPVNSSTSVSLQLRSLNGFSGTVNVNPSVSPAGLQASVNPASITLTPGAEATSTLFIGPITRGAPAGGFIVTVNATGAGPNHSVTVHVTTGLAGPDFSIACCWPSYNGNISVAAGSTYSSSAKLESLNNFTGTVSVTVNLSLPASVYPSTIIFPAPGQVTVVVEPTVTISASAGTPPGLYIGNVEATSGSLVHFAVLTVRVIPAQPDFGISSSQSLLLVHAGSANASSIGIWSINSFSGTITLSYSATPGITPGSVVSLKPLNLTLTAQGAASSILTISAASTAESGNYTILVTASYQASPTGPTVSHSVTASVFIIGAPAPAAMPIAQAGHVPGTQYPTPSTLSTKTE